MKKGCIINRKGYFFLIDSIIALGVLAIGAFLILTSYTKIPFREGVTTLSEDIMDFFANSQIKNINNEYAGIGGELWNLGLITNSENTLLQQVAEFYAADNLEIAEKFIVNLTENRVPDQLQLEFWLDGKIMHPRNPSQVHLDSKDRASVIIPSKKIVYGVSNKETGVLFGPYKAEVLVFEVFN